MPENHHRTELFPDRFWPARPARRPSSPARPARPGCSKTRPCPAPPNPVCNLCVVLNTLVSQCVCEIRQATKDHCSFAGVCAFSTSAHKGRAEKNTFFFLRQCFVNLNILKKCLSGLSAAGLPGLTPRPGPGPACQARAGPGRAGPTNSATE